VNNDIKTNDDDELLYVNNDIKTNHSLVSHEYINVDDSVKNPNPKHESSDTKFNVPTENTSSDNATTTDKSQQQSQEVVITTKPLYENVTSPVTPTARPRSQLNKGSEDNATEEPVQTAQTEPSPKREDFEEEAITI